MDKTWVARVAFFSMLFFLSLGAPHTFGTEPKTIILTFDDGPNPIVLGKLLPLLKTYNAHASFFVVGSTVVGNESWVEREALEGHTIENHSWGHENMKKRFAVKGGDATSLSLDKTAEIIKKITGRSPKYFRPPFWEVNKEIESIAATKEYRVMKLGNPDLNSLDYDDVSKKKGVSVLIERVKAIVKKREEKGLFYHIFVFHELPLTADALTILLPYFKNQGYSFSSLP